METGEDNNENDDDWKEFKSYYVVWKQVSILHKISQHNSLNRTM